MKFLIVSALMVLAVNAQYSSGGGGAAKPAAGASSYGGAAAAAGPAAGGASSYGGGAAAAGPAAGGASSYGGGAAAAGPAAGGASSSYGGGAAGSAGSNGGAGGAGAGGSAAKPIGIIKSVSDIKDDGSFSYSYETENGIKAEASGAQKQVGPKPEDVGSVQKGSYSYTSPEGQLITVNWVADENGFQATGDHLPTPPPMPAHVVKMLADLKASGALNENGLPATGGAGAKPAAAPAAGKPSY